MKRSRFTDSQILAVLKQAEAGTVATASEIEDPPGIREGKGMKLYLAYLRDPDGHKICALHRM